MADVSSEIEFLGSKYTIVGPKNNLATTKCAKTGLPYEFKDLTIIEEVLKETGKAGIAVDIGANIGNHSVAFSRMTGISGIVSFEMLPDVYDYLRTNLEASCESPYRALNVALTKDSGGVVYAKRASSLGQSKIVGYSAEDGLVECPVKKLDDVLEWLGGLEEASGVVNDVEGAMSAPVALIKIDVEGHEKEVLEGSRKTLEDHKPLLMIEIFKKSWSEVGSLLVELGYSRYVSLKGSNPNHLFVHDDDPDVALKVASRLSALIPK